MSKKQIDNFTPSRYQKNIFDYIIHQQGNLVIEASAGSGKTTTIIKTIEQINKDKKILFCAFNKDIVKELSKKTKKLENVTVSTIHGLGYATIVKNIPTIDKVPNMHKYRAHFTKFLHDYTDIKLKSKQEYYHYINNIIKLTDYGRYNLAENEHDIINLAIRHEIDIVYDEPKVVLELMEWGKTNLETMDFNDMVWLPNVLPLKLNHIKYDFIFVDEAQDMSKAQREFILKCAKLNTRYGFIGDENQAIYSFSSADPQSFLNLKKLPNTTSLPLSVSYRCPKKVVNFVKTYVNSIEPQENAEDGEICYNVSLEEVKDGDMILCRNNAPLTFLYAKYIGMGKKCIIKGKDIGMNLISIIKVFNINDKLNVDLQEDGLFLNLYKDLARTKKNIMIQNNIDSATALTVPIIVSKIDSIETLKILSQGINNVDELIKKIHGIFSDKKSDGIILSTIHKAKGLEADNVYIACPSLLNKKNITQEWEQRQEKNLAYVAFTRPKKILGFLEEKSLEKEINYQTIISELKHIESIEKSQQDGFLFNEILKINKLKPNTQIQKQRGVGKTLSKKPSSSLQTINMLIRKKP